MKLEFEKPARKEGKKGWWVLVSESRVGLTGETVLRVPDRQEDLYDEYAQPDAPDRVWISEELIKRLWEDMPRKEIKCG